MKRYFYILIPIVSAIMAFSGCSPKVHKEITADNLVIFPPPPDTARIQYLTRFSNSIDVTGERSGFMRFILGEEKKRPIIKPYGIYIFKGRIYICDSILGGLEILDLNKKTFDYFQPQGLGLIKKPINCFVDKDGMLYVADAERKQIVVFNQKLKYQASFCDAKKMKPTDVQVVNDEIWVCDLKGHQIHIYSKPDYKLLRSFPLNAAPKSDEFLNSPTNLFVTDDYVYVSDFGAFKIKVYTRDGKFVRTIGSYGKALGQFVRPKGIAVDRDGLLHVVDAGFENVQIFDKNGKLLMFYGGSYKHPGNMWLPAKVIIDYDNLDYFKDYVHKSFNLKYLIFVTNQYGPDKVSVYGFIEPKTKSE